MKKNLNQDNFESFLQQAADGHKMYPNDRVWQAIDEKMERQRKWPALRFASALLVTIVMGVLFYAQPDKTELHNFNSTKPASQSTPAAASKPANADNFAAPMVSARNFSPATNATGAKGDEQLETKHASLGIVNSSIAPTENRFSYTYTVQPAASSIPSPPQAQNDNEVAFAANLFTRYEAGVSSLPTDPTVSMRLSSVESAWQNASPAMINKAKASRAWRTQLYLAPSISYRFINETGLSAVPLAFSGSTQSKLKNLVEQRPLFGMEAGVAFIKPLTSGFNFRIGLQGNYRGFEIDGWNTTPAIASINVSNSTDNLNAVTSISNVNGNSAVTLRNRYVQVAIPIGFDFAVTKGKRVSLFAGASIQPTYTVAQKSHVLSSDYKYYMEQPDLMRKVAMNNSAELGLRVQGKKLQYQFGPQVRYQLTPTTKKEYSIRENLIDYGFKIGISKTN